MKRPLLIMTAVLLAIPLPGCQSAQPAPGTASAKIHVTARPKTGAEDRTFTRVPVYDAAPTKPAPTGQWEHVDYAHLSDVLVWLQPQTDTTAPPPSEPLRLDLQATKPHATLHPASVGQRVVFANRSSQPLSLYSVSEGNDFDLPPLAPGASADFTPKTEGLIEVLYDPRQPPLLTLYAAPSPWVRQTHSNKTVTFLNLPPGKYEATAWHPRLPTATAPLTLTPNHVATTQLTLTVNGLPTEP